MTKEEIKALVAAKIAGQGTAVDAGGALAPILNAIVDLLAELPIASAETLGGIKVGANLSINEEGVLSAPSPSGVTYIGSLDADPDVSGKYRFYADDDFEDAFILDVYRKFARGIPVVLRVDEGEGGPRAFELVVKVSYNEGDIRIETEHWFART